MAFTGTVYLWDVSATSPLLKVDSSTLRPLRCFSYHSMAVVSVCWNPGSPSVFVTVSFDQTMCVWHAEKPDQAVGRPQIFYFFMWIIFLHFYGQFKIIWWTCFNVHNGHCDEAIIQKIKQRQAACIKCAQRDGKMKYVTRIPGKYGHWCRFQLIDSSEISAVDVITKIMKYKHWVNIWSLWWWWWLWGNGFLSFLKQIQETTFLAGSTTTTEKHMNIYTAKFKYKPVPQRATRRALGVLLSQ